MSRRQEAYLAIDSERKYQDSKWGGSLSGNRIPGEGQSGGDRSTDEFALYIIGYANDLLVESSHFAGLKTKLDIIRKITALGVACMEQHGAPLRISDADSPPSGD